MHILYVCVTKSTFMLSSPCRLSIIIKYSEVIVKNCRSRLITLMVGIKRITIAHINLQRDHKWPRLVTWSVLNSIFKPLICLLGMGAGKVQFSWTTVRGGEVTSLGSFYGLLFHFVYSIYLWYSPTSQDAGIWQQEGI